MTYLTVPKQLVIIFFFFLCTNASGLPTISQAAYEKVTDYRKLLLKNKYKELLTSVDEDLKERKFSNYEKSILKSLKAEALFNLDRKTETIYLYNQLLYEKGLPDQFLASIFQSLISIQIQETQYEKALNTIYKAKKTLKDQNYKLQTLEAKILFHQKEYQKALDLLSRFKDRDTLKQTSFQRDRLLLQFLCNRELKRYATAIEHLTILIKIDAKKIYLEYLANLYFLQSNGKMQLAITEMIYESDLMTTESELLNLSYLLAEQKNYFRAAQILDKEFKANTIEKNAKNYALLARLWYLAKETESALDNMKKAGAASKTGSYYLELAYFLAEAGQWQEAEKAVSKSLNKGLQKQKEHSATLLKGQILHTLKRFDEAKYYLAKAYKYTKTKKDAEKWLQSYEKTMNN